MRVPHEVALVLGGGGVKAAAHVGAWRALAEAGITPTRYFGTSMGAVFAAAFAAGLTPEDIQSRMVGVRQEDLTRPGQSAADRGLAAPSLFDLEPLRGVIGQLVPVHRFSDLKQPLTVTATNLDSGELTLFGAGGIDAPLIEALLASCALPVFYPPVVIDGHRYADGGLRAVLPLEPAGRSGAGLVIAIDTGPGFDEAGAEPTGMPPMIDAHNNATGILMAANTQAAVQLWRATPGLAPLVYIRPRVEKHVTFRVELAGKYAEEGYRATREGLGSALGN